MRDGPWRCALKRVMLWRYQADLAATRSIRKLRGEEPRYELRGKCNGCGECCESPTIHVPLLYFLLPRTKRLFLAWQRVINGFEWIAEDRRDRTVTFRCTHYNPVAKTCDSYDSRPGMCRDYPANLVEDVRPEFLPGCSHYAVDKNAELIRESLADLDLPPEKIRELEQAFFAAEKAEDGRDDCSFGD